MWMQSLRLAVTSIARNKLRSLLTLLGVIIGVAAVVAMLTIGSGARQQIRERIVSLGSNLLIVWAEYPDQAQARVNGKAPALQQKDFERLARQLKNARMVAAVATVGRTATFGSRETTALVNGVTEDFMALRNWAVTRGRALSRTDVQGGAAVCVIGQAVRRTLFGPDSPIGASIRLGALSCTVIGLLESKGSSFGESQDRTVLIPLETFQTRISGNRQIDRILLAATDERATDALKREAGAQLRQSRRIEPGRDDNFTVEDMAEIARFATETVGMITALLGAIAGISLLVGGIGIMNIMLVSVTERTREIGIRMAVGARQRDILSQFLVEASVLSLTGGLIGIGLGFLIAWPATVLIDIPFAPSLLIALLLATVSAAIGVIFGFVPALRGSRLDPIDALRHE